MEERRGRGEDKDLLREFHAHYRTKTPVVHSNSQMASSSPTGNLLSTSSIRSHTERGSSRVASFIAEAQQRSSELDAFLQSSSSNGSSNSSSNSSSRRSTEGGKKQKLKSGLAAEVAAAVAAREQRDKAEAQVQAPIAPPPIISDLAAAPCPVPRVRRKEKRKSSDQAVPPGRSPLLAVLPPLDRK